MSHHFVLLCIHAPLFVSTLYLCPLLTLLPFSPLPLHTNCSLAASDLPPNSQIACLSVGVKMFFHEKHWLLFDVLSICYGSQTVQGLTSKPQLFYVHVISRAVSDSKWDSYPHCSLVPSIQTTTVGFLQSIFVSRWICGTFCAQKEPSVALMVIFLLAAFQKQENLGLFRSTLKNHCWSHLHYIYFNTIICCFSEWPASEFPTVLLW